jgi:hypothetical protein
MTGIGPGSTRTICLGALAVAILLGAPAEICGQSSPCARLRAAQDATYGFSPSRLSDAERKVKAKQMDQFWETAKMLGPPAAPCLQQMLASDRNDPFFLFDGSSLLLSLDSSPVSLNAISAAVARTDLKDVEPAGYIRLLLQLSRRDVDIGPLARKYMEYPSVDTYLPEHGAMKLTRVDGALLLYGSMEPNLGERYLEALAKQSDSETRGAAVFALALNMTEASFRAFHAGISLGAISSDNRKAIISILRYEAPHSEPHPKLSREQVLKRVDSVIRGDFEHVDDSNPPYVAGDDAFEASAVVQLTPADLPLAFEARRKSVRNVSDESLDEYVAWSHTILGIINRNDLYRDLRTP